MTRREWEDELIKYLSDLPKSECDRVLEYYEELYEDKRELNIKPQNIISEFGNPLDVATKILDDYRDNIDDYRFEPIREEKKEQPRVKEVAPEVKAEKVGKASARERNNYKGDFAASNYKPYSENKVKVFDVLLSLIYIAFCVALGFSGFIYVIFCVGIMLGGLAVVVLSFMSEFGLPIYLTIGVGIVIFSLGLFMSALSGILFRLSSWCSRKVSQHINKKKAKVYDRRQQL